MTAPYHNKRPDGSGSVVTYYLKTGAARYEARTPRRGQERERKIGIFDTRKEAEAALAAAIASAQDASGHEGGGQ